MWIGYLSLDHKVPLLPYKSVTFHWWQLKKRTPGLAPEEKDEEFSVEICRNSLLFRCNKLPDSPCVHARVQGSNGSANLENAVSIGESASTKQYLSPTLQEGTVTHVSNFKF